MKTFDIIDPTPTKRKNKMIEIRGINERNYKDYSVKGLRLFREEEGQYGKVYIKDNKDVTKTVYYYVDTVTKLIRVMSYSWKYPRVHAILTEIVEY